MSTPTPPLATTLLETLNRVQRHQQSGDITKLEAAISDLTKNIQSLSEISEKQREIELKNLAQNRWQLDTIISTLEAGQSTLRQKLIKQRTAQTAQKSYGQYNK